MLTINKNCTQRQMPRKKEITADKSYTDIIFGYLQSNCEIVGDTKRKVIAKKNLNFSKMGAYLGLNRQTVSRRFNKLIEMGLIEELPDEYELMTFAKEDAFLIELSTLRILTHALSQNSINIYIYLLGKYIAEGEESFEFSLNQLKSYVGLSTNIRTNNSLIIDILNVLQKLGLLVYKANTSRDEKGQYKTSYTLQWITNTIKC